MVTRGKDLLAFFAEQHRADRQAAAKSLCQGNHIRFDPVMLMAEEFPAAANPRLHFVVQKQHVIFRAEFCRAHHKIFVQRNHAAFALDHLHHHAANGAVQLVSQVVRSPART